MDIWFEVLRHSSVKHSILCQGCLLLSIRQAKLHFCSDLYVSLWDSYIAAKMHIKLNLLAKYHG